MEQKDYRNLLPDSPPDFVKQFIYGHEFMNKGALVFSEPTKQELDIVPNLFRYSKHYLYKCSCCDTLSFVPASEDENAPCSYNQNAFQNEVTMDNVWHEKFTLCPTCENPVKAFYFSNRVRTSKLLTVRLCVDFYSFDVIDKIPVFFTWRASKVVLYEPLARKFTERIFIDPAEAFVVEERKLVRLSHLDQYSNHVGKEWRQIKGTALKECVQFRMHLLCPFAPDLFTRTTLENAKLFEYCFYGKDQQRNIYPLKYIHQYLKNRNLENLISGGDVRWIDSLCYSGYSAKEFNASLPVIKHKTKPHEIVGLSKDEFKFLTPFSNLAKVNYFRLKDVIPFKILKEFNLEDVNADRFKQILKLVPNHPLALHRYISKHYMVDRFHYGFYHDYLVACEKLDYDLTDPHVLFPKDLRLAHDRANKLIKQKANKVINDSIKSRLPKLEKYKYSDDKYIIRAPLSHAEFINEGTRLNHCVATYAERHGKSETTIFFVRKKSSPNTPFYTLEYSDVIIQCRTLNNKPVNKASDLYDFINYWDKNIAKGNVIDE